MNVMNRSMFVNRDARSKLAGMGGIMSSSPELMSASRQGFADGGQTSFLERVNEVGVEKAPTYIISSPILTGGNFLEISAETLSALNSVVPNLLTPDGESIFVADAASVSPLSREQARPGDAIVGTRLKQMMAQMQSAPQAAPAPALDDVFDQRIRQGLEPDGRASLDEELFDSAVYRDPVLPGQALAEAYALGNSPKQLMQEASSVTPMDMSNGDPDFSGIMKLQQAEEKQQQDFAAAAEAASNSRALLRERGMSASQRQRATDAEASMTGVDDKGRGTFIPSLEETQLDNLRGRSGVGAFSEVPSGIMELQQTRPTVGNTAGQDVVHEASIQPTSLGLNLPGTANIPAESSGRDTAANRMIAGELMAQRAAKAASDAATETVGDPAVVPTSPGLNLPKVLKTPAFPAGDRDVKAGRARSSLRTPEPAGQPIYSPADVEAIVDKDPKNSTAIASKFLEQVDLPQGDTTTNLASYKKLIQEIMGGGPSEKQRNQEKWNNFAMIGFAIAAGQSPNAMTNIAQGMLQGTKMMANQREAEQARRDKLKGMEFDMLLSDRAAGQDRKTKFGVAGINADSRAATAAAKAAAEGFLDTDVGKGMDKIFASLVVNENAVQTPNALMEALKKLLNSPAYNEEQQDNFILAKGFNQATIDAVREGRADSSSSGKTTMKDIPD